MITISSALLKPQKTPASTMKAGVIKCIQTSARTKALDTENFLPYSVTPSLKIAISR